MKALRHIYSLSVFFGIVLFTVSCGSPNQENQPQQTNEVSGTTNLTIDYSNVVAEIQPTMYGIFFEDINFAADGGIYAEMIKNRSFEFTLPMMGWDQPNSDRFSMNDKSGFASVIKRDIKQANAKFLRVNVKSNSGYALTNEGFRSMGIKEGLQYNLTLMTRVVEGNPSLRIDLVNEEGQPIGGTEIKPISKNWESHEVSFDATATAMKGKFQITFEGEAVIDLDMISLFPSDTWKNRPKGMRADLVQKLADLDPGFLRFPGGCIVEGRTLDRRYQWKKTVGVIEERELLVNRWNTEFAHRPTPDYYQSFGLGFFEYFQLAEDMGAEPLPILGCGMACQFNTGELVPMDEMGPYVADALDLIEFANGNVNSKWGSLRAEMGHPEPFNMKYIGVGNEQWGPEYIKRYKLFEAAIKKEYPDMIIVSGSGPFPDGEMFEYGMAELKKLGAEIVDEHYYRPPGWFLENADRYDSYDRNGPQIFAGEYAAQSVAIASPDNKNNWNCALSEAAYMTGLERNADVVTMTSYAPLFAHAEGWQWTPDLIWFNNLESYGTPNYEVQKLFSNNPGTHLLTAFEDGKPVIGANGVYASAVKDENANELILKLVNVTGANQMVNLNLSNATLGAKGTMSVLASDDPDAINSFENPENILAKSQEVNLDPNNPQVTLTPKSLNVLRIKVK